MLRPSFVTRGGFSLTLWAEPAVGVAVADDLAPYFGLAAGLRSEGGPVVTVGAAWPATHPIVGTPIRLAAEDEPEAWIARLTGPTGSLALLCAEPRWLPHLAARLVRDLCRRAIAGADVVFLHGGCLRLASGAGIAVVGPKRAGKTSTILSGLLDSTATYVTNDDLVLRREGAGWTCWGWPRSISVRPDTLPLLAPDRAAPAADGYPGMGHRPTVSLRLYLTPAELAAWAGSTVTPTVPLSAVLFPRFCRTGEQPSLRRLSTEETRSALARNLEPVPSRHGAAIEAALGSAAAPATSADLDLLARSVVAYRVHQTYDSITRTLDQVDGLLAARRSA